MFTPACCAESPTEETGGSQSPVLVAESQMSPSETVPGLPHSSPSGSVVGKLHQLIPHEGGPITTDAAALSVAPAASEVAHVPRAVVEQVVFEQRAAVVNEGAVEQGAVDHVSQSKWFQPDEPPAMGSATDGTADSWHATLAVGRDILAPGLGGLAQPVLCNSSEQNHEHLDEHDGASATSETVSTQPGSPSPDSLIKSGPVVHSGTHQADYMRYCRECKTARHACGSLGRLCLVIPSMCP